MESESRGLGCTIKQVVTLIVVVVVIAAMILLITSWPASDARDARSSLAIERAEALQPWNLAVAITIRILLVVALLGLLVTGFRWLDTRARLIRPDRETGQMPAYRARRGETVIDMNRSVDGKTQTALLGGKTALFLALFFRYLLKKEPPPELHQPAVTVLPPDTSPEQMQITSQDQVARALLGASRCGNPQQVIRAAQMLAPPARRPQDLPPILVHDDVAPRETQLLLEQARREWDQLAEGHERD